MIKLSKPRVACVDSTWVKISHILRLRSKEGASGHALDKAWVRNLLPTYGTAMVNAPCKHKVLAGNPDAANDILEQEPDLMIQ